MDTHTHTHQSINPYIHTDIHTSAYTDRPVHPHEGELPRAVIIGATGWGPLAARSSHSLQNQSVVSENPVRRPDPDPAIARQ